MNNQTSPKYIIHPQEIGRNECFASTIRMDSQIAKITVVTIGIVKIAMGRSCWVEVGTQTMRSVELIARSVQMESMLARGHIINIYIDG